MLANDLSAQAVENMRRNLTLNGYPQDPAAVTPTSKASNPIEKVFVNEGDCLWVGLIPKTQTKLMLDALFTGLSCTSIGKTRALM